jgi:hypothetical protein
VKGLVMLIACFVVYYFLGAEAALIFFLAGLGLDVMFDL